MAYTFQFVAAQNRSLPNTIVIGDSTTGTGVTLSYRKVYLQTASGSYLVETGNTNNYTLWNFPSLSLSLNVLTQDTALSIRVDWYDVSDNLVGSAEDKFCFSAYNKAFFYYLIQLQSLTPDIVQDNNYYSNLSKYWINIVSAEQAIILGSDLAASQHCLNVATYMMNNQSLYF